MDGCERCRELEQHIEKIKQQQKNERERTLAVMRCTHSFITDRKNQLEDILIKQTEGK